MAQKFASSYLKYRYKNLHKVFLAEDVTLDELAIDAIAPLFERNDDGVFVKLKTAFENWQPPIETEEKAQFFLNRLVSKSIEKYASELLRDSDPFFSKILDSVNYQIEKHGFKKKQILGTTYIVDDENPKRIGCLPDAQFILELPVSLFLNSSIYISSIFNFLRNNADKEIAIPLNALVHKLKMVSTSINNFNNKVELSNEFSVDSILENAFKATIKKLDESYMNKGKVSVSEKIRIEKALLTISADLKDGGINPGLHKYFLEQFHELNFDGYRNKFQNVFEYLYKEFRKEIIRHLNE
jgi:hypothetical protein